MGLQALTHDDNGDPVIPESEEDWQDWVSATATRNYVLNDPLVDWLAQYGKEQGFLPDNELDGYDERTDFGHFIMDKGLAFESAVVDYLKTRLSLYIVGQHLGGSRGLGAAEETLRAMERGEPAIYQVVLRDPASRTYGTADLLLRSDELCRLFPAAMDSEAVGVPAPDLGDHLWHYRVVDIKFTTLHFLAGGALGDGSGSAWAYKAQVYIYNRALGRMQGYLPPEAYLLGRGWEQTSKKITSRGSGCMDRLGAVLQGHVSGSKGVLAVAVEEACGWVRRSRREGGTWRVLPEPSVPELRPNMTGASDEWHTAKQRIGHELEDLTLLWQVGVEKRTTANEAGVFRWSDSACTSETVGVRGATQAQVLQKMLDVNRSPGENPIRPARVHAGEEEWRPEPSLEFYVDFETVSDLDDDFSNIPDKGGQPLIFMIGCGHVEQGEWRWRSFTADTLSEGHEATIIDAWLEHMRETRGPRSPQAEEPRVFHWSHAEVSTFESAFNSAKRRHPDKAWEDPRWFDFLKQVMKTEPVVVQGAMGFGLKSIATAMRDHGSIDTAWGAGPTDGLGAMVGAWSSAKEASERGCTLPETELMQEIERYNEVDCKVMMEIVRYLRAHH